MLQKNNSSDKDKKVSREQKHFHELLEKIQRLKKQIEEKKQLADQVEQHKNQHIRPLLNQLRDVKLAQVRSLDWAYDRSYLQKRLKIRLREEIIDRTEELLSLFAFENDQLEELMSIAARHRGASIDELEEERKASEEEATRAYLKSHYGINLEDHESADLNDPEVVAKLRERIANEASEQKSRKNFGKGKTADNHKAKSLLDKMTKSIRSVYTSLVKHLHPDKELDEAKKAVKTEAMKEVTLAYENKDMLGLLILQAQHGIIESDLADSDLRGYNNVLKQQVNELEKQHNNILTSIRGVPLNNAKAMEKYFKVEQSNLKKHIRQEQEMLQNIFENDYVLTEFLKRGF